MQLSGCAAAIGENSVIVAARHAHQPYKYVF
jgi:hypothetical protein